MDTVMTVDIRAEAVLYYDLNPNVPQDVPFYRERIPAPDAHVLELGCGTGRTETLVNPAKHMSRDFRRTALPPVVDARAPSRQNHIPAHHEIRNKPGCLATAPRNNSVY
jgi:hypothetical protein